MGVGRITSMNSMSGMWRTTKGSADVKSKNIQNEIKDLQQQMQKISSNEKLSVDEKANERKLSNDGSSVLSLIDINSLKSFSVSLSSSLSSSDKKIIDALKNSFISIFQVKKILKIYLAIMLLKLWVKLA